MPNKINHLLLATLEDPFSRDSWSGTPYHLRCALEKRLSKVTVIGKLKPKRNPKDVLLRVALGGNPPRYPLWMTRSALRGFAREVRAAIDREKPDAVLSISSQCLIELHKPSLPLFMFADAPWLAWKNSYRQFESMPIAGRRFAKREGLASKQWNGVVFGSDWAVEQAKQLYSIERNKIHAVQLGANWTPKLSRENILQRITQRSSDVLELLYVGKDWERKGGPLAVQVAESIHERGIKVRLHIVGCRPAIAGARDYILIHGVLRQDQEAERNTMQDLFLSSHFLIVPTMAECFGVVFAEAQAFGLPPVSRAIHALPSVVLDGKTGLLMEDSASASQYAERILQVFSSKTAYEKLAAAARDFYESNLNWDAWADRVVQLMESGRQ